MMLAIGQFIAITGKNVLQCRRYYVRACKLFGFEEIFLSLYETTVQTIKF